MIVELRVNDWFNFNLMTLFINMFWLWNLIEKLRVDDWFLNTSILWNEFSVFDWIHVSNVHCDWLDLGNPNFRSFNCLKCC